MDRFDVRYGNVKVHFGEGAMAALEGHMSGYRSVLVVTGRGGARASGALEDATRMLSRLGVSWSAFDGVAPNPTHEMVNSIASAAKGAGAEAILAIGGGSVIDSAKFASVLLCSGGEAKEYLLGSREYRCKAPVYAVNLTHGTGSEIDRYSVASIEEEGLKMGLVTAYPDASVDDPTYAVTLPRDQTAYTSIDAFYHAFESATSKLVSPFTSSLASEAARIIADWLPKALAEPTDLDARGNLLYAAAIAGVAIDNSMTHIIHVLEHVISGLNPTVPHGAGLAILGPRSVFYTYRARPTAAAKVLSSLDRGLRPHEDHAARAQAAVIEFQERVGLRETLSDYGFSRSDLGEMVMRARSAIASAGDRSTVPFPVTDSILEDILSSAL